MAGLFYAAPAVLWVLVFFCAPVILTATYSLLPVDPEGGLGRIGTGEYDAIFSQSRYLDALCCSLTTTAIVVCCSTLLAYPFAYGIARRIAPRFQRVALAVAVFPFWTSYVVRSYAWLLALSPTGVVNCALRSLHFIGRPLALAHNSHATELGFIHFFIMLNTLTIYANLVQIDPSYLIAAQDLGASKWRGFLTITLPLSVPGIAVGAFLTAVLCIGDYVTPEVLGGVHEPLLPQLIMTQIRERLDLPLASAMSLILTGVVAVAYLAMQRWFKTARL